MIKLNYCTFRKQYTILLAMQFWNMNIVIKIFDNPIFNESTKK